MNEYRFRDVRGSDAAGSLLVSQPALASDLDLLTQALTELRLSTAERQQAARELHATRNAARADDRVRIGGHLRTLTELLHDAGALPTAGTSVVGALTRIGHHLGPAGAAVLERVQSPDPARLGRDPHPARWPTRAVGPATTTAADHPTPP
jgi:hypothetical protein